MLNTKMDINDIEKDFNFFNAFYMVKIENFNRRINYHIAKLKTSIRNNKKLLINLHETAF